MFGTYGSIWGRKQERETKQKHDLGFQKEPVHPTVWRTGFFFFNFFYLIKQGQTSH